MFYKLKLLANIDWHEHHKALTSISSRQNSTSTFEENPATIGDD